MIRRRLPAIILVLILLMSVSVISTRAVEIPPTGGMYIQTNGPSNALGNGDWYTNNSTGAGKGYHYVSVNIPCDWPTSVPVHFDLFSPAISTVTVRSDEVVGTADTTTFEIYAPGTVYSPYAQPAPGATGSLYTQTYPPSATSEVWTRFYTTPIPVVCGTYVLRIQTQTDDQNGWRLRVGSDNDTNPANTPPANYDNPDGIAGTNDEITIGVTQVAYENDTRVAVNPQCLTLYQYVDPGKASVTFNNFDMDSSVRVRYYPPSATYDPTGQTGGIAGTVSGGTVWNNGGTGATRVGDTINNPESGWWKIVSCVWNSGSDRNQFIQEGQTGAESYFSQPPTPKMIVSKDDGRYTVGISDTLYYTIAYTNVSNLYPPPGAATNVVLTDVLPPYTTFQGCVAPSPATCSHSGGVVSFHLNQTVIAGGSGTLGVTITLNPGISTPFTNTVNLNYTDGLNNPFPPVTDIDTDIMDPTAVNVVSFSATPEDSAIWVRWIIDNEQDTAGFHIRRGITPNLNDAVTITPNLIAAQGVAGSPARYQWLDDNVEAGVTYYYWLEEHEISNNTNYHGPVDARIVTQQFVYIPLLSR